MSNLNLEIPTEVREFAEKTVDQARKAFDSFVVAAQKATAQSEAAAESLTANAREVSSKAIGFAEANVRSSLDYAEKLLKAKDMTEVLKLHSEHVQAQMRALADQASEMGQAVARAAVDAAKPKS